MSKKKNRTVGLILAGGIGKRMRGELPKQFLNVGGKPIIVYSLDVFGKSRLISDIVVVCHKKYIPELTKIIKRHNILKVRKVVAGGKTRQESAYHGLKSCPSGTSQVLIHDAARPLITEKIIRDVLSGVRQCGAADTVIDATDTIVLSKNTFIEEIPPRKECKRGQTPQGFDYQIIWKAHQWARRNNQLRFTDDCSLAHALGHSVKIVAGSVENIKITKPSDIFLAEKILAGRRGILGVRPGARSLKGKVAVVAGGTGAIGKAVVKELQHCGCRVIPVSRSSRVPCDVRDEESICRCYREIIKTYKRIDILINLAGIFKKSSIEKSDLADWQEVIDVNLTGAFLLSKHIIPILKKRKGGHILHVSSSSRLRGRKDYSAYSASKAALVNFSEALADEAAAYGIAVNTVSPHGVNSPMRIKNFGKNKNVKLLSKKEVAQAIVRCCLSPETGRTIDIAQR